MEPMKNDLTSGFPEIEWTMSHESPPWNNDAPSQFLSDIQASFVDGTDTSLPLKTTHAAVECGILSKKYPQTEWVSVGGTISDMHTTRESIKTKDFEEFVERMEALITRISNEATQ
jgi:di/tripeptidase